MRAESLKTLISVAMRVPEGERRERVMTEWNQEEKAAEA
jgi:hypothetical protein